MLLELKRNKSNDICTLGTLYVDGKLECYTLEDPIREEKIKGKTAIPARVYGVIITESARFKRLLPLLKDVPNFEGVRIHSGNTAEDTEGCILVGKSIKGDSVLESRKAFEKLFKKMQNNKDGMVIKITDPA